MHGVQPSPEAWDSHLGLGDFAGPAGTQDFPAGDVPADFIRVPEADCPALDRRLGYSGHARFVMFNHAFAADEIIWRDDWSYGCGTGTWQAFVERIIPLAAQYRAHLGSSEMKGTDVLVIDRVAESAYFARRKSAEDFLAQRRGLAHQFHDVA